MTRKKGEHLLAVSPVFLSPLWGLNVGGSERFLGGKDPPTLTLVLNGLIFLLERAEKGKKWSAGVIEM